ncbi:MAG: tetratricopeptide repeat protein [Desulfuromonadales bacterium]|nr:tetratricopeptide repeat protein [Desulfuromonadales bacterium]
MISSKLFRANLVRLLIALTLCVSLSVPPGFCQDTEDSQIFIAGFNAYQQHDFATTIAKMDEVLKKYPDTTLRDMALFWLARAHFKNGHPQDAARIMSQFSKEYPDSPLRGTVEEELLTLAARYDRGEKIPASEPDTKESIALKAQAEQKRIALLKAEQERIGAEKAEKERLAESARLAAQKAEQERGAEAARMAQVKAEQEQIAAEKAEQLRLAAVKAETARIAVEKAKTAEAEHQAVLKAEQERQAAFKAEQERLAKLKTEQERIAAEKVEQARVAEVARLAQVKAEQERIAAEKVELQRLAAVKAESERIASEKAEKARVAEAARLAAAKAEREHQAALKAEQERIAAEKVEKARTAKSLLREKAIDQYKSVIQSYPNTKAAATAATKLRQLGVSIAMQPQAAATTTGSKQLDNEQIFRLEVAQFAALELSLQTVPSAHEPARPITLPFEITNQGNGNDSFDLESGFPAAYASSFAAAATPDQTMSRTPVLAPGETFKGVVRLTIPPSSIDGLRITHPIKAVSHTMGEATQSREIHLTATAPLLRAIVKTDKTSPLPGEKLTYRVVLLNIGSTAAKNVSLRLSFPPQLEPLDHASTTLKQGEQSTLVIDGIQLKTGESRELPISFRLKDDSLAGQELLCRAELIDKQLKTSATFVSNAAIVKPVHGVLVRSLAEKIVIIPGQTVYAPFVVTNSGNIREKFTITREISGAGDTLLFHDQNRDGIRQPSEPIITEIGPLEPKEEASIVMEVKTSRDTADASEGSVRITFSPEGDASRSVSGMSDLIYSRPVLQMTMASGNGRLKPGDVASFDLSITNRGSNLARVVDLRSTWPEQLEFVASEPAKSSLDNGRILWKFKELGAGEKRSIKVSFRVKQGIGVGTNIQVSNILNYEDQLGNRY